MPTPPKTPRPVTFEERRDALLRLLNAGRRIRITPGQARAIRRGLHG